MIERVQDGEKDWTHEMQVMRRYFSAHGMGWVLVLFLELIVLFG